MKKSSLKTEAADYKSAVKEESDYKSDSANYKTDSAANLHVAELTLAERVMAPTPKFFKTLRTIGLVIGLVGGVILASPVALPAAIVTVGGYLALAGSIVTGVSQTAVEKE
jgi:hypothetical protein